MEAYAVFDLVKVGSSEGSLSLIFSIAPMLTTDLSVEDLGEKIEEEEGGREGRKREGRRGEGRGREERRRVPQRRPRRGDQRGP